MPDECLSPDDIQQAALLYDALHNSGGGTVIGEPGNVIGYPDDAAAISREDDA